MSCVVQSLVPPLTLLVCDVVTTYRDTLVCVIVRMWVCIIVWVEWLCGCVRMRMCIIVCVCVCWCVSGMMCVM